MTTIDGFASSLFDEIRSKIDATEFGSRACAEEIEKLEIASKQHATIANFFMWELIPD